MSAAEVSPIEGSPIVRSMTLESASSSVVGLGTSSTPVSRQVSAMTTGSATSAPSSAASVASAQPSIIGHCGRCKRGVLTTAPKVRCVVCSTNSVPDVISNVCLECYRVGAYAAGHPHEKSFCISDDDKQEPDPAIPSGLWVVRRNVRQLVWYTHVSTGYKTYNRPLTAVCGLPVGWTQFTDAAGTSQYRNAQGQIFLNHPNGLHSGWREAKDPDGKVFYVHDRLQLTTWHHPALQPQLAAKRTSVMSAASPASATSFSPRPSVQGSISPMSPGPTPVFSPRPSLHGSFSSATTASPVSTGRQSIGPNGQPVIIMNAQPHVQVLNAMKQKQKVKQKQPLPPVTLGGAAAATVNLVDPTHGGIVRNTKIVAHITGKGVGNTVNAIANNKPLKEFAKGTGMTAAKRKLQSVWKNAGDELAAASQEKAQRARAVKAQGTAINGQLVFEQPDATYSGEYFGEWEDGTIARYSAQGQFLSIVKPGRSQSASFTATASVSPGVSPTFQRPPMMHAATTGQINVQQRPAVGRPVSVQAPLRRPVAQQGNFSQQQQLQLQMQQQQQQQMLMQQGLQQLRIQEQQQQQQDVVVQDDGSQVIFADPQYGADAQFAYDQQFDMTSPTTMVDPSAMAYGTDVQTAYMDPTMVAQGSIYDPSQMQVQESVYVEQDEYVAADGTLHEETIEYDQVDVGGMEFQSVTVEDVNEDTGEVVAESASGFGDVLGGLFG